VNLRLLSAILIAGSSLVAEPRVLLAADAPTQARPGEKQPPAQEASSKPEKGPSGPKPHAYSYYYDILNHDVVRPMTRVLDPALLVRKVTGNPREAANVDADDQVRLPSTWWQPRLGFRSVTVPQMMNGPGPGRGPAPGKWIVTKGKSQGVTPGFQIKDSKGDKFIIKFDPPQYPELCTSCDVIGSYLFWAAGYNVPENTIETFARDDLEIADDATYTNRFGQKHRMTDEYLEKILASVAVRKDGRFRCTASRYIDGKPIGPFQYAGRRSEDPEDRVPHELRRELRGLWVMCAFTNHADSRGPNTLDSWVTAGGRSFVRHYLIDFSAILGAGPFGPRALVTGTEYYADYGVMARQTATAGLAKFAWENAVDPNIPSVGRVESAQFDPEGWRPDYPNPAFDERTDRDARWGARIVAAFTDEHIRAAVAAAQYSDPRAAEYVTRVLIERRDKIARRWLGAATPELQTQR
jgi:hypothetical protein